MEIRLAENGDLSGWVQLVEPMRHLFPGLETPESMEGYARTLPEPFPDRRRSVLWKTEPSAGCWPFPGRKMSWLSWQFQRSIGVRELPGSWQSDVPGAGPDPSGEAHHLSGRGCPRGKPPGACTSAWDSVPAGWWRWTAVRHRNSCARRKFPVLKGVRQSEIPAFRGPAHRQTP